MRQPTRLIRDSADRYKLKVSLPGGRYQLSLDDRAVIVLVDQLGLSVRDKVPEPFVPFFVAMGDAWFPRQRDIDAVIQDLPSDGTLSSEERSVLFSYLTESRIAERNEERVRRAIENSPIAGEIEAKDLQSQELPSIPNVLKSSASSGTTDEDTGSTPQVRTDQDEARRSKAETDQPTSETEVRSEAQVIESLQQIPGIGPHRAKQLVTGGIRSLEMLTDTRPVDLASIDGVSEDIAAVAVEGAREILGHTIPASERLRRQTGVTDGVFSPALSSLAASGVPASEAIPSLRVLLGPTVAEIDSVSGQQAYFLWEAGYQTPYDVIEASTDELADVYQVGSATAPKIQASARELLEARLDR